LERVKINLTGMGAAIHNDGLLMLELDHFQVELLQVGIAR
jgi:hypothetical protein